jgi:hypothetical protein
MVEPLNLSEVQRRSNLMDGGSLILASEFTLPAQFVGDVCNDDNQNFFYDRKINSNRKTKIQQMKLLPQNIKKQF